MSFLEQARVTSKQIAVERNLHFKGRLCSGRFKLFFFFFIRVHMQIQAQTGTVQMLITQDKILLWLVINACFYHPPRYLRSSVLYICCWLSLKARDSNFIWTMDEMSVYGDVAQSDKPSNKVNHLCSFPRFCGFILSACCFWFCSQQLYCLCSCSFAVLLFS